MISAFVSYQRTEELSNAALTNGGLISSIASYQYFERLSDQYLRSQTSPPASYFFQYGTGGLQITVAGKVTDVDGTVIPGATIQASVGLRTIAVTTADTSGQYELSPLDVGLYVLTASAPAHASSARVLSAVVSTALQNFQLPVLPGPPPVTATTRPIPSDFAKPPSGPMNSSLKVFDANQFVSITAGNWVTADRAKQMTVVLTHGWIITEAGVELVKGVEGWPTDMARKYQNAKVTGVANIIAWDWHDAAASPLPPQERTPAQGLALGAALQAALGTGYEQPIHFLGHSLGTLVNACAANYLHGDRTAQQETAPTEWSPARTYLTLFDQAEVSRVASLQVLYDGLTLNLRDPTAVIRYVANTLSGWAPSMPINSAWADNYISLVGFYLPNTVNVALQKAEGFAGFEFWNAHGYPMQWYALSIDRPGDSILGFQRSREYLLANSEPVDSFPPPDSVLVLGDAYHQEPSAT
ncbi:MAG: carboxypeptidase regulatory-like domain-containing protein, partial [Verrucomicrobiota bacterium]